MDLLLDAAADLQDHGHIKHQLYLAGYEDDKALSPKCALGALNFNNTGSVFGSGGRPGDWLVRRTAIEWVEAVSGTVSVVFWNNRPERTPEEVEDTFRAAAYLARGDFG